MIILRTFSLAIIALITVTACSSTKGYQGESKPSSELAKVIGHGVNIESANGIAVGSFSSSIEVPSGQNEFLLTINASNFNDGDNPQRQFKLVMRAEAGKTYAITGRRGDARLCAFPLDSSGDPNFSASAGCITRVGAAK